MEITYRILEYLEMAYGFWNRMFLQSDDFFDVSGFWKVVELINCISICSLFLFMIIPLNQMIGCFKKKIKVIIIEIILFICLYKQVDIMKGFFMTIGNLVNRLTQEIKVALVIDSKIRDIINGLDVGSSGIILLLTVPLTIIIMICGIFLILNMLCVFFEILFAVPKIFAESFAQDKNEKVRYMMLVGCKYIMSRYVKLLIMILAIICSNVIINSELPSFTNEYADWVKIAIYFIKIVFMMVLTVISIKIIPSFANKILLKVKEGISWLTAKFGTWKSELQHK